MTIHCADCHGELDPAYFDTRCRDCNHDPARHIEATLTLDAVCTGVHADGFTGCECCEWQQKILRCEQCTHIATNQASYDNLTPWQQWKR
jgi:hypothetical protein